MNHRSACPSRRTRTAAASLALLAAALLTACANPLEAAAEKLIEQQTGVEIDRTGDDITLKSEDGDVTISSSVDLPEDFPADMPVPNGRLESSVTGPGTWMLTYQEVETAELQRMKDEIVAAGFAETYHINHSDGGQGAWSKGEDLAALTWSVNGGTYTLFYQVTLQ